MMKAPLSAGILPVFELVKISVNIDKFTVYFDKFMKKNMKLYSVIFHIVIVYI